MNKAELVDQVAEKTGATKADTNKFIDAFAEVLTSGLQKKERIAVPPLGVFDTSDRKARKGRNPQTGEEISIPATTVVKFKPSKALKEKMA